MNGSTPLEWIDSEALSSNSEIDSRNRFARRHTHVGADEIRRRYTYLTADEFKGFIEEVAQTLGVQFHGCGVELSAGVGVVSNTVAEISPGVEKIFAVEIVPDVVRFLQMKVTKDCGNESRVIPVIGSFDDLQLPDESVDFIIEFDSLHHSNDLSKTLSEARRVLRKGGFLMALDRVHFDALTEIQRRYLLDIEYSAEFKAEYGLPLEQKFTREQNGEHEIRESEWRAAFAQAGLTLERMTFFHRRSLRGLLLGMISQIPYGLRRKLRLQPSLSRFPLAFFQLYLPFNRGFSSRFSPLHVQFSSPHAFMSKTVMVARRV